MSAWEAIEGNCLPLMAEMEPRSFDAVITDPPDNVGKDYGTDHSDRLSADEYRAWLHEVLRACARVSRGPVVFFPGLANALDAAEILKGTGLRVHRLLGWHKREFAGDKWNGGPAMCWEPIVWATAEPTPFFNRVYGNAGRDFLVVNERKATRSKGGTRARSRFPSCGGSSACSCPRAGRCYTRSRAPAPPFAPPLTRAARRSVSNSTPPTSL